MDESALADFAARLQLSEIALSADRPFAFVLDGKYACTLEYQSSGALMLTLSFEVPPYNHDALPQALAAASYLQADKLRFAVAFHQDKLCLLTELSPQASGADAVNQLLALVETARDLKEH